MSVNNPLPSNTVPGAANVVTFVNGSSDRYRALCLAMVTVLQGVKLDREDLQDALADLSDILDGIRPSPRSGFTSQKPSRR